MGLKIDRNLIDIKAFNAIGFCPVQGCLLLGRTFGRRLKLSGKFYGRPFFP